MSEASSQLRAEQQETQSMQSVNVQSAPVNLTQTQRSSSQAERSDRSGGRQRFQRSSSSGSSSSESGRDNRGATNASGAGSQLYANGVGFAQNGGIESGSQGSFASGERRRGRFRRQVIRLPDQAQGQVRQVRRRLPTPEPDTIERVYIQRTPGEVVEEITEIPTTPPPRIQERTQIEPAGPPQVIKRVIRVPPRGTGAYDANYQQGQAATNFQTSSVSVGSESLAQTQQVNTGFNYPQPQAHQQQQQQFAAQTGVFTQPGPAYQGQQSVFQFSVNNTGFPSQPVRPPVGCHPAFCFYV